MPLITETMLPDHHKADNKTNNGPPYLAHTHIFRSKDLFQDFTLTEAQKAKLQLTLPFFLTSSLLILSLNAPQCAHFSFYISLLYHKSIPIFSSDLL